MKRWAPNHTYCKYQSWDPTDLDFNVYTEAQKEALEGKASGKRATSRLGFHEPVQMDLIQATIPKLRDSPRSWNSACVLLLKPWSPSHASLNTYREESECTCSQLWKERHQMRGREDNRCALHDAGRGGVILWTAAWNVALFVALCVHTPVLFFNLFSHDFSPSL